MKTRLAVNPLQAMLLLMLVSVPASGWRTTSTEVRGIPGETGKSNVPDITVKIEDSGDNLLHGSIAIRRPSGKQISGSLSFSDGKRQLAVVGMRVSESPEGVATFYFSVASNWLAQAEAFLTLSQGKYENMEEDFFTVPLGTFEVIDLRKQAVAPIPSGATSRAIAGKWRSVEVVDPKKWGPRAWELHVKESGEFTELIDQGFKVAAEHSGNCGVIGDILYLKPSWRDSTVEFKFKLDGDSMTLVAPEVLKWSVRFERSDKPIEALRSLPKQPRTLKEAVEVLKSVIEPNELQAIRKMREENLGDLHFSLGLFIRNGFGLWRKNHALLESCGGGDMHPDTASGVIIEALWENLQQAPTKN